MVDRDQKLKEAEDKQKKKDLDKKAKQEKIDLEIAGQFAEKEQKAKSSGYSIFTFILQWRPVEEHRCLARQPSFQVKQRQAQGKIKLMVVGVRKIHSTPL